MRYFCTYFDRHYLTRGLTLYRSLQKHAGDFVLWVLCLDDVSYDALTRLDLPNLRPISLPQLEKADPGLLEIKQTRSRIEYYFTCSPVLPLYILNSSPDVDLITYLDADLFFYADPQPLYDELGDESILIIEHRFPARLRYLESRGVFNVGLLAFRNDPSGRQCLDWWRERCLEWCYDRLEDGRFADQKYLNDWPTRFSHVVVLQHKGANLAPWNWSNYHLQVRGEQAMVDGQPLIFYHFHGLKCINDRLYEPGLLGYGRMPSSVRRWLYGPYMRVLHDATQWAHQEVPNITLTGRDTRVGQYGWLKLILRLFQRQIMMTKSSGG